MFYQLLKVETREFPLRATSTWAQKKGCFGGAVSATATDQNIFTHKINLSVKFSS